LSKDITFFFQNSAGLVKVKLHSTTGNAFEVIRFKIGYYNELYKFTFFNMLY